MRLPKLFIVSVVFNFVVAGFLFALFSNWEERKSSPLPPRMVSGPKTLFRENRAEQQSEEKNNEEENKENEKELKEREDVERKEKKYLCVMRLHGEEMPTKNSPIVISALERFNKLKNSEMMESWIFWDCKLKDSKEFVDNVQRFLVDSFVTNNVFVYTNKDQQKHFPDAEYARDVSFHFSFLEE